MKVIDSDLFNLKGFENPVCSVVLDCSYLELIREEAKVPRIIKEKVETIKEDLQKKEKIFLIIGVTKPNGEFSELRASIPFLNPLDAKGCLTIYPPDLTSVPPNSEIELLRYEIFPVK